MDGYFRVEVKIVKRTDIRSDGTVGKNSALKASAYITAERIENNPLKASAYISAEKVENTPVKASAYISGVELHNKDNRVVADYSNKKGVLYSAVVLPKDAPKRLQNPEVLWNEVEKLEGKRKDSILFREWICCLEKHLTMEEKFKVTEEFAKQLASEGMAVQYAIHQGHDGNDNDHIHYLGTVRGFENGEWKNRRIKPQKYLLDEDGNRIPVIDKNTGEQKKNKDGSRVWKKSKVEYEDTFNEMYIGNVKRWRRQFAEIENKYLAEEYKVSAESYETQGIDKIPGQHLGKAATNVQKKLTEQVQGLSEETRKDYLQKILEQVQKDYRKAYYENSRMISANRKKIDVPESDEHKLLRREISQQLHSVTNYRPQKKYVSNVLGRGHLQIEYALVELMKFCQTQLDKSRTGPYADVDRFIRTANLLTQMEEHLIITFSTGITRSCEVFIIQNEYEMQKELLKQLGKEIRETEQQISLLQGKDINDNVSDKIEQELNDYAERIEEFRNRTIVESAERITETARELRESEDRLAELRRGIAGNSEQISGIERRSLARKNKKVTTPK